MTTPSISFYRELPLSRGYVAILDASDFELVDQWSWYASVKLDRKTGEIYAVYAAREIRVDGKRTSLYLHRFLMGVTDRNVQVDHENHDTLDYRRSNLRIATQTQNMGNTRKTKNNKSGFKGVHWNKQAGKYAVEIGFNYKNIYLGLFVDPVEGAKAYDVKALELFGEFACLNFPNP